MKYFEINITKIDCNIPFNSIRYDMLKYFIVSSTIKTYYLKFGDFLRTLFKPVKLGLGVLARNRFFVVCCTFKFLKENY